MFSVDKYILYVTKYSSAGDRFSRLETSCSRKNSSSHDDALCTHKTAFKLDFYGQERQCMIKIVEGTRKSHHRTMICKHPGLGKPGHGLPIMNTLIGFPFPFPIMVIDCINLSLMFVD